MRNATDAPTESMQDLCDAATRRALGRIHTAALEADYDLFLTTYTGIPLLARHTWCRDMQVHASHYAPAA